MNDLDGSITEFIQSLPDDARSMIWDFSGKMKIDVELQENNLDQDGVEQLLREGRQVPPEMILQYPELLMKYGI